MPKFEEWEISKYWEIFSGLNPVNGLLSGDKVATVLKNSQLPDPQLEKIWDLSDVDGDGNLDFEEFCIAMRLIFDIINGTFETVPDSLPEWLIPSSKAHLVTANNAVSQYSNTGQSDYDSNGYNGNNQIDDDEDDVGLSSDFNWYISPSDRNTYSAIYSSNADYHGLISFESLTELYASLPNVPETDISSAWNLVNPRSEEKIEKEQCIVFLHILNIRNKGTRIPRSVPASLRATFEKAKPEYNINSKQSIIRQNDSSTNNGTKVSKKSAFAEGYLSRLGLSGRSSGYNSSGTDFSSTKDTDWEEVRLRRQLADLESLIKRAEEASDRRKQGVEDFGSSNSALLRREFERLLEYKENQLRKLRTGEINSDSGPDLKDSAEEVDLIVQQVKSLNDLQEKKQAELKELQNQLASV